MQGRRVRPVYRTPFARHRVGIKIPGGIKPRDLDPNVMPYLVRAVEEDKQGR